MTTETLRPWVNSALGELLGRRLPSNWRAQGQRVDTCKQTTSGLQSSPRSLRLFTPRSGGRPFSTVRISRGRRFLCFKQKRIRFWKAVLVQLGFLETNFRGKTPGAVDMEETTWGLVPFYSLFINLFVLHTNLNPLRVGLRVKRRRFIRWTHSIIVWKYLSYILSL